MEQASRSHHRRPGSAGQRHCGRSGCISPGGQRCSGESKNKIRQETHDRMGRLGQRPCRPPGKAKLGRRKRNHFILVLQGRGMHHPRRGAGCGGQAHPAGRLLSAGYLDSRRLSYCRYQQRPQVHHHRAAGQLEWLPVGCSHRPAYHHRGYARLPEHHGSALVRGDGSGHGGESQGRHHPDKD